MSGPRKTEIRRGTCVECGREFRLRKDGMVGHHDQPNDGSRWGVMPYCKGYGCLPVEGARDLMAELQASLDTPNSSSEPES